MKALNMLGGFAGRRVQRRGGFLRAALAGAGIGAALEFLLDPKGGTTGRRALVRNPLLRAAMQASMGFGGVLRTGAGALGAGAVRMLRRK